MSDAPLFRAAGLACARGGVPVLGGVDLTLAPGAVLVVRGPNGVGKTTLLRTCAGLQPPLEGTVEGVEETVLAGHRDGIKAGLTVRENIAFWAALYGLRVPENLYADYALDGLRDRPAGTLSAGQARRLGLARVAVTGRRVWLLDEPTVSLDAPSVALFAAALARHAAAGGAALVASHVDLGLGAVDTLDLGPHAALAPDVAADDAVFL